METRSWLRLERWLSAMLLILSMAWVALHIADMRTLITGLWITIGITGIMVCLRAQLKLRSGISPASRRRHSSRRH